MMIWLSLRGLTASEIAALFEYDPRTVRRWIDRYNREGAVGLEDRPRSGASRLGGDGLARRIRMLLREPGAWTVKQLRRRLGYPAMYLTTLARRVREQASLRPPTGGQGRPRGGRRAGGAPPGDRGPARRRRAPGRGRGPRQPAALAPIDLDRQRRAAGGDDAGQEREAQRVR